MRSLVPLLKGVKTSLDVHRRQLRRELPLSKLYVKCMHSTGTGTQSELLRGGGERAIQLAIQCARNKSSIPAGVTDGMSPPELRLFLDVFKYHTMIFSAGGLPESNQMHSFREIARGLDCGGLELSNKELLHSHLHVLLSTSLKDSLSTAKTTFINPGVDDVAAKHICTSDLSQLQPIDIDQLAKGVINEGKILWAVSMQPCFRISGLNLLIQDRTGRLATLSLYNSISTHVTSSEAQLLFPVGTRLGIKEPYYKMQNSGKFGLRSDNPCNVIVERPKEKIVGFLKIIFGSTPDSSDFLKAGNKFLEKKRFEEAAEHYGMALTMAGAAAIQLPLYLNRAAARLGCKDFPGALADSKAALAIDGRSVKGKYRMGQALFGLRRFTDARDVFASLVEAPGRPGEADESHAKQLRKASAAIEQSAGRYDLMTFPFTPDEQGEADVAEFFGPIEVRWTEGRRRGRGLFLTADAKAGQLLLVERPMAYCMEDSKTNVYAVNMDKTVNKGSQHGLISDLTLLAHRDPRINALLAHLSTGELGEQCPLLDVGALRRGGAGPTPVGPISAFAVKQMVKINAFEIQFRLDPGPVGRRALEQAMHNPVTRDLGSTVPALKTGPPLATRRQRRKAQLDQANLGSKEFEDAGHRVDKRTGTALWAVASMMNHAAKPSTMRRFVGQMMFVSAGRDLRAGEELTTSYSLNPDMLRQWNIVK